MHNDSVGVHGGVIELRYLHGLERTLFLSSLNSVSRDDHQVELLYSRNFLQVPKWGQRLKCLVSSFHA
jgi:hypothetical protein